MSLLREFRSRLEAGKSPVVEPCLPSPATMPPAGSGWIHEIKHDGYRMMVRRDGAGVRLITRNGYDWTSRYPMIAAAANAIRARSFLIDGEAVVCDETGLAIFQKLRHRQHDASAFLYAFDLIELNGKDLRREPIERRKAALGKLLQASDGGIRLVEHLAGDGAVIYEHAVMLGCEGIVSKRLGSRYRSGRTRDWLKVKNPAAPAVNREAAEDWNARR